MFAIALGLGGYVYTASGKGKADFKAGMSQPSGLADSPGMSRDRLLKIAGDTMLASAMGANRPVR